MNILFICNGNTGRSQIAQELAKKIFPKYSFESAGVNVFEKEGEHLPKIMLDLFSENNINANNLTKKQLTKEIISKADKIVSMIEKEKLPESLKDKKIIIWKIENPKNTSIDFHRKIFKEIEEKIINLF